MAAFILAVIGSVAQVSVWHMYRERIEEQSISNRWNIPTAALFFLFTCAASRFSGFVYRRRIKAKER